jgi:transmembrane sensor
MTSVGEVESVRADDGSIITINTNSSLRVLMSDSARTVHLEKGEAYFDVEHDPDRYFDVLVNDTVVRAIGTAFSVQKNGDAIQVIVTEGVVEILSADGQSNSRRIYADQKRDLLHPGQKVDIGKTSVQVKQLEKNDLSRQHTWRDGMLVFDGETLEEVISEFGRYNNIQMHFEDDEIRNIRVGGYFNSNDVAGMLNALQGNFGVKVTYLSANTVQLASLED